MSLASSISSDMELSWILYFLPVIAALIGWMTNFLAVKMLFHPKEPKNIFGFSLIILFGLVLFTLNYFIYQYSSFTLMIFTAVIVSILYIEMGIILSRNFFVKFFDDQLPKEIIYFIGFILMINAGYFTIMFILRIIKANTFI